VNSFLNLLCHEFVFSTTYLFAEYFFRKDITFASSCSSSSLLVFFLFFFFFFLIGICRRYPHLISSCSSSVELYPLSRHRCCFCFLLSIFDLDDVRLITILSTTSVTRLISWVLTDDITADSGILSLSVKICLFVPSLLLSVGLFPVLTPLKVIL